MRADFCLVGCHMKSRSAVDTVAIHDCHGGYPQRRAGSCQVLGNGCAFEEAESGAGVKFGVHEGADSPRRRGGAEEHAEKFQRACIRSPVGNGKSTVTRGREIRELFEQSSSSFSSAFFSVSQRLRGEYNAFASHTHLPRTIRRGSSTGNRARHPRARYPIRRGTTRRMSTSLPRCAMGRRRPSLCREYSAPR
jgi:hypothetical protein